MYRNTHHLNTEHLIPPRAEKTPTHPPNTFLQNSECKYCAYNSIFNIFKLNCKLELPFTSKMSGGGKVKKTRNRVPTSCSVCRKRKIKVC